MRNIMQTASSLKAFVICNLNCTTVMLIIRNSCKECGFPKYEGYAILETICI